MLFKRESLLLVFVFVFTLSGFGQVKPSTFGNLFINSGGFITIFGEHNFMNGSGFLKPGIIRTDRSNLPGTVNYSENSAWSGASESQFVDGFVKSFQHSPFTFPIGHKEFYRPICLSNPHRSLAAYFRGNPVDMHSTLESDIQEISTKEYWAIQLNEDSQITLSWALNSQIEDLSQGDLTNLTIVGLSDQNTWEIIPSSVDEFVLNVSVHKGNFSRQTKSKSSLGSISTVTEVEADKYSHFAIASLKQASLKSKLHLNIYPNPQVVGGDFYIDSKFEGPAATIRLYSSNNAMLHQFDIKPSNSRITIPYKIYESGSYIIGITDSSGRTMFKNIILIDP